MRLPTAEMRWLKAGVVACFVGWMWQAPPGEAAEVFDLTAAAEHIPQDLSHRVPSNSSQFFENNRLFDLSMASLADDVGPVSMGKRHIANTQGLDNIFDLTQGRGGHGQLASGSDSAGHLRVSSAAETAVELPGTSSPSGSKPTKKILFDLTQEPAVLLNPENTFFDLTVGDPVGTQQVFDLTRPDGTPSATSAPSASSSQPATSTAPGVARGAAISEPDPGLPRFGRVARVIDGDTYVLDTGDRIRLSCVNTPEKRERIGPKVTAMARRLLLRKDVELRYGPVARDGYGRLIADVRVDGESVAERLLREGMAHLFIIPPTRPEDYDRLVAAQREARRAGRGIWQEKHYRGVLHITSFHANARGDDRQNLAGEYLRIANTSLGPLNLGGFTLTNAKGRRLKLPDLVIPEGYTFQIFSGKGEVGGSLEVPYKVFWDSKGPIWNNDFDQATLETPDGVWVDDARHAPKRAHPKT